jgi:hypothetical protein
MVGFWYIETLTTQVVGLYSRLSILPFKFSTRHGTVAHHFQAIEDRLVKHPTTIMTTIIFTSKVFLSNMDSIPFPIYHNCQVHSDKSILHSFAFHNTTTTNNLVQTSTSSFWNVPPVENVVKHKEQYGCLLMTLVQLQHSCYS